MDDDTENNFKPLLADFEEENNCEVKMELIPWDTYEEKWSTAISGGDIYADDLKSARFNDKNGAEAIEFFKSLKDYMPENLLSLSGQEAFSTIFGAGKAAFGVTRSSQSHETLFKESYPDLNWDYVTSLKNKDYGTFGAADSLSIMSTCEEPELAMELIKCICRAEFMTEYHKVAPGAPLTKSESYNGDPKMERIVTDLPISSITSHPYTALQSSQYPRLFCTSRADGSFSTLPEAFRLWRTACQKYRSASRQSRA